MSNSSLELLKMTHPHSEAILFIMLLSEKVLNNQLHEIT